MAEACVLCPRQCHAARTTQDPGYCGVSETEPSFRVARLMVHPWEEPMISGVKGSGTVFFSGCSLRCCFCQNAAISHGGQGSILSQEQLLKELLCLLNLKVENLNLVTAGHYADRIPGLIRLLRQESAWKKTSVPIVWNSSAYETVASLDFLADYIDIYLPDIKFFSTTLSGSLAQAPDYFNVASKAILAMHHRQPETILDRDGIMKQGMIIRHLVLPGHWQDSCRILDFLAENLPLDIPLSLMCQYTPQPCLPVPDGYPEISRRLTTLEYQKVLNHALDLGFCRVQGQYRGSADAAYTPDFSSLWGPVMR